MPTYFAWTPILVGKKGETTGDKTAIEAKTVKVGEQVSASSLGVSDDDFEEMVNSGAVREYEYPDLPKGYPDSPINFMKDQIRKIELAAASTTGAVHVGSMQRAMTGPITHPALEDGNPDNDEVNDEEASTVTL